MNKAVDLQNLDEGARALVQRLLLKVEHQATELKHKQALLDKLAYEMALLKRLKFAAKTEALNTDQRSLLEEALEEDLQAVHEEVEQMQPPAERAKCCRRPKTDHLNLGVPTQN